MGPKNYTGLVTNAQLCTPAIKNTTFTTKQEGSGEGAVPRKIKKKSLEHVDVVQKLYFSNKLFRLHCAALML